MAYSWKSGILGGVSVAESATAGTPLATLVAQDGGIVDAFYYTLGGQDSSLFNIDLYGRLSLKQAIDYDTTGGTSWWRTADGQWHAPDHRYTVVVNAFNDANQIQATTTFILTMGDVNEAPVFQWQLQPFWSPNSSGSGWNNWNAASNTMFLNLAENITASGLQVAKFVAVDPDLMTPSNVTYDLVGTDAGYFSINSNGALILKSRLDYEDGVHTAKNYSVVVKAASTDGGSLASSNLVVISLGNVDDNATVWNGIPATGVAVNETAGITNTVVRPSVESVADFRAVDADGQTVKYSLGGADSWMFSIDSNGVLYRTNNVDYETSTSWRPSHQFSVTVWAWGAANTGGIARDGAGISKLFILTINNVDELGTGFTWAQQPIGVNQWRNAASGLITVNISENNALGMAVGQFAATDGDGVAVTYNLSGADAAYFSINNNGALTLKSSLNYEDSVHTAKNYSVVVTAKSTDVSAAISSLFVLSLQDNTKEFVWTNNPTGASISETAALVGVTVADFNIGGGTIGSAFTEGTDSGYWLVQGFGDVAQFNLNQQTGALTLRSARDYETDHATRPDHRFTVAVGAWRDGGGEVSQVFVLTVANVNEPPVWSTTPLGTKLLVEADGATFNYTDPFTIPTSHGTTVGNISPSTFTNYANGAVVTVPFDVGVSTSYAGITYGNAYIFYRVAGDSTIHEAQGGVTFAKGTKLTAFQIGLKNVQNGSVVYQFFSNDFVAPLNDPGRFNVAGGIVATFAAVDQEGDGLQYSVTGTDASRFIIDGNGKLILTQSLDYEAAGGANYSVVVVATANGGVAISQNFILSLGNSNDEFAWSGTQTAGVSLLELTGTQVVTARALATFTAYDSDANTGYTPHSGAGFVSYVLDGTKLDSKYFTINKDTGVLSFISAVDGENGHGQLYSITIWANEINQTLGTPWISRNFVLTVGDVEESPIAWQNSNSHPMTGTLVESYNELQHINQGGIYPIDLIIPVSPFTDWQDIGGEEGSWSYSPPLYANGYSITLPFDLVILGDNFQDRLRQLIIRNSDGSITTRGNIGDRIGIQPSSPYAYTVAAGSVIVGYGTYSASWGAYIKNRNFDINVSKTDQRIVTLAGGVDALVPVTASQNFFFTATDSDVSNIIYSVSGTEAANFTVASDVGGKGIGKLTYVGSLDYETTSHTHTVTVVATSGNNKVTQLFILSVTGLNDEAAVWTSSSANGAISENNVAGVALATFLATDPDGAGVTYSLSGTDANLFSLSSSGGGLQLISALNYEGTYNGHNGHVFSVIVNAWGTAGGAVWGFGLATTKLFVLSLGNVNEFATGFAWAQQPLPQAQYSQGVSAQGWSAASSTMVANINENNTAGMTVAQFLATDGDTVPVTYSLSGVDAGFFDINGNGALTLKSSLDYESTHVGKNYSVVVTATSTDGSPAVSSLFVVSLGNVDDNATVWSGTPVTGVAVNETAGITNTVVLSTRVSLADFRAIDGDGQTVKYSLAGDTAGMFSIDSNGVLYRTRNVDYETSQHQFSVTVWAWGAANTDGIANDGAGINKLFILTINNVNEFGTGFTWAQQPIGVNQWRNGASGLITVGVSENNAMGMAVGQFAATDGDQVAVTYNLGGTDAAYFSINNNGALTLKSSLDYESTHVGKNYSVVVTATSTDGSPAVSSLFVVSLGNVDDNATVWSGTPATGVAVNETAGITNTVVLSTRVSLADFRAIDADGQTVKYSLAGDTAGMFSIDSNGVLYRTRNVDYETSQHQFSVTVWAWGAANTDGIANDGAGINKLFILTINNVNELGTGFTWAQQPIGTNQWRNGASGLVTVGVNENNAMGMAVGQFAATDGDQVAVTYNLGGTDAAYFSINNNGALTLKSSLDYESTHVGKNYSVVVTATSTDGSPAVSSLFVVSLGNVDDNATVWSGTPATGVAVNETAGITNTVVLSTRVSLADFRAIDGDGQTVKYSLAGDTAGMFSIDSNGVLYRTRNVDYETSQHQFSVTVWAWGAANTDGIANDGAGINKLFILTINNVNELGTGFTWAQQPIGVNQWRNGASGLITVGVSENNAMGMAVGQFAATDGDGVSVTYSLSGADAGNFSINNNGALTLKSSLDYESRVGKNYSVVVTATSTDGSPAVSSLFVVSLQDSVKEFVWTNNPSGASISETAALVGATVADFNIGGGAGGTAFTEGTGSGYWLVQGFGDVAQFNLNQQTGVLTLRGARDYETDHAGRPDHRFSVAVGAWRDGGGEVSHVFVLTVTDANEAMAFQWQAQPLSNAQYSQGVNLGWSGASSTIVANISESITVGGLQVAKFKGVDADIGVYVTYNLGGTDATYFSIDTNGRLYLASNLDYESTHVGKNYSVVVTAKSTDGSAAISNMVVISLSNVDDNATAWSGTPVTGVAVNETAGITNTVVLSTRVSLADFRAIDGDGQTVKYSLVGDTAGMFSIDSNGVLYRTRNADYETSQRQFSVTVWAWGAANTGGIANDGAGINKLFILTINNVNDGATNFTWAQQPIGANQWRNGASGLITVGVNENNAIGMAVGQFAATDGDQVAVTYNLGGTDAAYFSINNNGALTLKSSLNYEDSVHTAKNYSVVVTATSTDGSPAVSSLFVVSLGNVDDNATVWSGTPATGVAVNETAGITNTVVLSTRVSLADFRAIDADGQTVKYSLAGDTAGMFSIDSNGVLYRTRNVDYETSQHQFSVTVWAWGAANTDGIANDGAGINKLFILTINSVNELGTGFTWAQQPIGTNQWRNGASGLVTVGVNENNAIGMAVGQFAATDGDQVAVTYNLGGTDAAYFSINNNGALTLKSSLDYEDGVHTAKNYSVVVTATSTDGSPAVSSLFVVSLGNVDDNATVWSGTPATGVAVNETAGITNTVVLSTRVSLADFRAIDGDGQTVKYSLAGDTAGMFSIDSNGVLYRTRNVDYETSQHQFSVTVWAWGAANTDGIANDGAGINKLFILTINNVNEFGTGFTWAQQPIGTNQWRNGASGLVTVGVNENNAIGMAVGQFAATDGDQVAVTYNLGGTDAAYFSINNNGALTLKSSLDYESTHVGKNYSVVVTATSTDGSPAVSSLFVVSLGNVDDNATAWSSTPATGIAIDEKAGIINSVALGVLASVANFKALDADGQTVTYSLDGADKWMFSIDSNGVLYRTNDVDYETSTSWRPSHQFSVTVWAWGAANSGGIVNGGAGISKLFVLTINNISEPTNFSSTPSTGIAVNENNVVGLTVGSFRAIDGDGAAVTYSLGGTDATYFSIDTNGNLKLRSILDFEDANHTAHNYSVVVQATSTDGGATISSAFVLSLGNVAGANHADHTAYIDGTTATHVVNVGGIIGHGESGNIDYANVQFHGVNYTDKVITHNVAPDGLQSTMVDYVSRGISDLESLRISFNGFTDTDGSKRNHWFFVQDDATDNSGHIVFDADGQNVNLHSFANGGGLATADQINLLAGSNYGIDGDFAKPTDLNLNLASDLLHQNIAGALTFDQFLALLGGSQHISFV